MYSIRSVFLMSLLLLAGCSDSSAPIPPPDYGFIEFNDTPQHAMQRFVQSFELKRAAEFQGMFTGDYTYEFSNSTDPSLVTQYSTGWFKDDEKEASSHLCHGYTPPGDSTLPAAATIDIHLAVDTPTDDNSPAVNPVTHKVLATRIDGTISVPQSGGEPLTYVVTNNYNVFWIVRGDAAVNLDSTQPADQGHWYIYRWVDLTSATPTQTKSPLAARSATWGAVKGRYR